jgi:glycosyltransferase involved in cell wall biosynthesis
MRIGFFADMYLPHISGITNHIRLYKRYFEEQGHEVFLITFGSTHYDDDEPNVVRNPAVPVGNTGWSYGPLFNKETRELIPTLDIVHTHHPFQSGSYLLSQMKKVSAPLVFTNHTRHDLYADSYARAIPYTLRHHLNSRYLTYFTAQCDLVIAPSAGIAQWLGEYANYDQAQVIPNGIDLSAFQNMPDAAAGNQDAQSESETMAVAEADKAHHPSLPSREQLGICESDLLLCYVGRVSHEKNIAYLLSEFASLVKENANSSQNIKLLVVGDGTEMDYTRDFARRHGLENQIILAGPQDYADIPGYVALCDAFITGSVSEVHPLVVIEALAAGLPVIAVASPGISDTVEHGKSGLLASSPEPSALSAEAQKIVCDATLRTQLSLGARRRAGNYCMTHTAGLLLESYKNLLSP